MIEVRKSWMEVGGRWRMEDGGWRMRTEMEDGGWRMEDGGGWRMEDGGWRMEDGGWRMEDGGWEIDFLTVYTGILTKQELYSEGVGGVLAHFYQNSAIQLVHSLKKVRRAIKRVSRSYIGVLQEAYPLLSSYYKVVLSQIGTNVEDWREVPHLAEVSHLLLP
jgi:hypothetical protein